MHRSIKIFIGFLFFSQVISSCKKLDEFVTQEEADQVAQKVMAQCLDTASINYANTAAIATDSSMAFRLPLNDDSRSIMRASYPYLADAAEDLELRINHSIHNTLIAKLSEMHGDLANIPLTGSVKLIYGDDYAISSHLESNYSAKLDTLLSVNIQNDFLTTGIAHEYAEFADEYNDRRIGKRLEHHLDGYCFPVIRIALFRIMKQEEYNIRHLSSHRTDPLLQRVFK